MQQLSGNISGLFEHIASNVNDEIEIKLKSIAAQYHKKSIIWSKLADVFTKNYSYRIKYEYEQITNKRIAKVEKLIKYYEKEIWKITNKIEYYDKIVKDIYIEDRKLIFALSHVQGNPSILDFKQMSFLEVLGIVEDTEKLIKKDA